MQTYQFEKVFSENSCQLQVWQSVRPLLDYAQNQTLLAYGHTGSGKTYTIFGKNWEKLAFSQFFEEDFSQELQSQDSQVGLCLRIIHDILSKHPDAELTCSFFQIYNEKIIDMLSNDNSNDLIVKQHPVEGAIIDGLCQFKVVSVFDAVCILAKGYAKKKVRETSSNAHSSRSHTIVTFSTAPGVSLRICDLAGSERFQTQGLQSKAHLSEMVNINKSLSTLNKVIFQLGSQSYSHIHFRESKLTRVLQAGLQGSMPIVLIGTIDPTAYYLLDIVKASRIQPVRSNFVARHLG